MLGVIYQHKMMNVKLYHEFGDVIENQLLKNQLWTSVKNYILNYYDEGPNKRPDRNFLKLASIK
jgi:hypothetical protein